MPPDASQLISALNHPLRRRILHAYLDGSVERASADEMAELLGERVGQIAYHLKTLGQGEILRPVERGDRRGWDLGIEPEWLRVVLEIWAEAEVAG